VKIRLVEFPPSSQNCIAFDTFAFGFSIQFCFAGRRAGTLPLCGKLRLELLLKNNFSEKLPEVFFRQVILWLFNKAVLHNSFFRVEGYIIIAELKGMYKCVVVRYLIHISVVYTGLLTL
jgi:hypothetical protein